MASLQYRAYCFQSFPAETNLLSQKETRKHWPVILVCHVCRLSRMALPPLPCPALLPPALPCSTAQPQPAEEGRGVRRAPAFPLAEAAAGNRGWWCTRTPPCRWCGLPGWALPTSWCWPSCAETEAGGAGGGLIPWYRVMGTWYRVQVQVHVQVQGTFARYIFKV